MHFSFKTLLLGGCLLSGLSNGMAQNKKGVAFNNVALETDATHLKQVNDAALENLPQLMGAAGYTQLVEAGFTNFSVHTIPAEKNVPARLHIRAAKNETIHVGSGNTRTQQAIFNSDIVDIDNNQVFEIDDWQSSTFLIQTGDIDQDGHLIREMKVSSYGDDNGIATVESHIKMPNKKGRMDIVRGDEHRVYSKADPLELNTAMLETAAWIGRNSFLDVSIVDKSALQKTKETFNEKKTPLGPRLLPSQ